MRTTGITRDERRPMAVAVAWLVYGFRSTDRRMGKDGLTDKRLNGQTDEPSGGSGVQTPHSQTVSAVLFSVCSRLPRWQPNLT